MHIPPHTTDRFKRFQPPLALAGIVVVASLAALLSLLSRGQGAGIELPPAAPPPQLAPDALVPILTVPPAETVFVDATNAAGEDPSPTF